MPRRRLLIVLLPICAVVVATVCVLLRGHSTGIILHHRPAAIPGLTLPAGTPALPPLVARAADDQPIVCWVAGSQARFEPCGCVAGMRGGLLRRASLLARIPNDRILNVELAGWSAGTSTAQAMRMDDYLAAAARSGVRCVAIGEDEIALGATALRRHLQAAASDGLPMLCANLVDASGVAATERWCVLVVANKRLLVTAVTRADIQVDGLSTTDPAAAARSAMDAEPGLPLVILADLDEDGLHALARAVPGAHLVVGGRVTTPTAQVAREGPVRIIHVANHGKTLGWWPWDSPVCAFELLDEHVPDQRLIAEALAAHEQRLSMQILPEDQTGHLRGFVGSDICASCHIDAARIHAASGHARSLNALVRRGYDHDPECLTCHVTGLGDSDGFSRLHPRNLPALAAVSCESCHGPGSAHVASVRHGNAAATGLLMVTAATCVRCHDTENSPQFDFAAYWPRISHGKDAR